MSAIEHAWRRQSVGSQTVNRLKSDLERSRSLMLGMSISSAVLATAAAVAGLDSMAGKALAGLGAFAAAVAALTRARAGSNATQDWTRARSVSEGIKPEVYMYTTSSGGYAGEDRTERLNRRIATLESDVNDLRVEASGIEPAVRGVPSAASAAAYSEERLSPQLDWYREKAGELKSRRDQIGRAQIILCLVVATLAAVAGVIEVEDVAVWVPVVATIGAAVAAYAAGEQYDFLIVEYDRTADELERLRDRRPSDMSDGDFIQASEGVISIQNEGWMAKLAGEEQPES